MRDIKGKTAGENSCLLIPSFLILSLKVQNNRMKQIKEWKIGRSEYEWTLLLCMNNIRYSKGNKSAWASVIACEFHKTFLIVLFFFLFIFLTAIKIIFPVFFIYERQELVMCNIYGYVGGCTVHYCNSQWANEKAISFENKCLKNYLFETDFFDECMALNQAEFFHRERERFLSWMFTFKTIG